jgi:hypothetical protein
MQRFIKRGCQQLKKSFIMKKYSSVIIAACIFLSFAFFMSGCVKDDLKCRYAYAYTYYQPLYKTTAEVRANIKSNPPREIENPGKIVILGNYIFLNELDKGIHVIDNSNPSSPHNIAFIDIPGNEDLAVKGNMLYVDLYTDLITLDISNPLNVSIKQYNEGVFPDRVYSNGFVADSNKVIVDWEKRDTTVTDDCTGNRWYDGGGIYYQSVSTPGSSSSNSSGSKNVSASPIGQGGSMARFAIVDNSMYTVSHSDLNVFNISIAEQPVFSNKINLTNWNIETIFPFKNKLFIGSQSGMYVYNINNPGDPQLEGEFGHVQSCDPVIADDKYAYVTLRSGSACQGFTNELEILKLNNFTDPQLLKTYNLHNPYGLSKDGNLLFICDGTDGLKVYDAANVQDLKLIKEVGGIETYDVIAYNKIALIVAKDGLYQYDYSDAQNIHLISKITILKS